MAIVQLGSAKNITELAQRLYGLGTQDARLATAVKALAAANPTLPADLSNLPATTAIVMPAVGGLLLAAGATSASPQDLNLLDLMRSIADASAQIVTAAESTSAPAPDTARVALLQPYSAALPALKLVPAATQKVDPKKLSAQLKVLSGDVEAFVKQHGGSGNVLVPSTPLEHDHVSIERSNKRMKPSRKRRMEPSGKLKKRLPSGQRKRGVKKRSPGEHGT